MKTIRTSSRRRKCRVRQCEQILSIYNHEVYCHAHLKGMSFQTALSHPVVCSSK
ncbi:MAG: hypothetical protein NTY76_05860 [Candidatus Omnitrophica bacterium]|nr:hypothetical protein [Candidatus Omnitrophota bacterium]